MPILVSFRGLHCNSNFGQASLLHGVQKYGKLTFKCKINKTGSSVTKRKVIVYEVPESERQKVHMFYVEQHILSKTEYRMVPRKK